MGSCSLFSNIGYILYALQCLSYINHWYFFGSIGLSHMCWEQTIKSQIWTKTLQYHRIWMFYSWISPSHSACWAHIPCSTCCIMLSCTPKCWSKSILNLVWSYLYSHTKFTTHKGAKQWKSYRWGELYFMSECLYLLSRGRV